jgi:hypothetical protein
MYTTPQKRQPLSMTQVKVLYTIVIVADGLAFLFSLILGIRASDVTTRTIYIVVACILLATTIAYVFLYRWY